jgi:hypothetical protein
MNLRVTRGACALLAAAALSAGTTSAASAAIWTHTDASGDVQTLDPQTEAVSPAPANTSNDIRSWRVAHNTGSVVVRITTASNLPRTGILYLEIATAVAKYDVFSGRSVGGPHLAKHSGKDVSCDGLKQSFDTTHHRIQVTVPRRCIGTPHWVKVGAVTFNMTNNGFTYDDGTKNAGSPDTVNLSTKVVVG